MEKYSKISKNNATSGFCLGNLRDSFFNYFPVNSTEKSKQPLTKFTKKSFPSIFEVPKKLKLTLLPFISDLTNKTERFKLTKALG